MSDSEDFRPGMKKKRMRVIYSDDEDEDVVASVVPAENEEVIDLTEDDEMVEGHGEEEEEESSQDDNVQELESIAIQSQLQMSVDVEDEEEEDEEEEELPSTSAKISKQPLKVSEPELRVYSINPNGLHSYKRGILRAHVKLVQPHVIMVEETKEVEDDEKDGVSLKDKNSYISTQSVHNFFEGYRCISSPGNPAKPDIKREKAGEELFKYPRGGTAIYIREDVEFSEIELPESELPDAKGRMLAIKVTTKTGKIYKLLALYIPVYEPNAKINQDVKNDYFKFIGTEIIKDEDDDNWLIAGDLNVAPTHPGNGFSDAQGAFTLNKYVFATTINGVPAGGTYLRGNHTLDHVVCARGRVDKNPENNPKNLSRLYHKHLPFLADPDVPNASLLDHKPTVFQLGIDFTYQEVGVFNSAPVVEIEGMVKARKERRAAQLKENKKAVIAHPIKGPASRAINREKKREQRKDPLKKEMDRKGEAKRRAENPDKYRKVAATYREKNRDAINRRQRERWAKKKAEKERMEQESESENESSSGESEEERV